MLFPGEGLMMTTEELALSRKLQQAIAELPSEYLKELDLFVQFLRFKARPAGENQSKGKPDTTAARRLRGILKGYDFSPEFIAEARRDMWRMSLPEDDR